MTKLSSEYKPYKGLISLQNSPPVDDTGFNWQGHSNFMANRYTIVDKHKEQVAFVQQPAQDDFLYHMSLYLNILVLKARKMGFSSTALGVATTKFLTGQNEKCVSMSFDSTASGKQLQRAKHYIKSYELNRSKALETDFKVPFKYNSKSELVFEGKEENAIGGYDYFQNTLQVGTAKSTSFGRGDDISFLHLTEVAFVDDIEVLLSGVGEACLPLAHKILETTANGFNSYKKKWDQSMLNNSGFAALFYSPEWEYIKAFLEQKRQSLGRLYPQEYPQTPQDAFLTSGLSFFDNLALRDLLRNTRQPL